MTTAPKLLTAVDLLALPDDGMQRELMQGALIEAPPASDDHGFVGYELALADQRVCQPEPSGPQTHGRSRLSTGR